MNKLRVILLVGHIPAGLYLVVYGAMAMLLQTTSVGVAALFLAVGVVGLLGAPETLDQLRDGHASCNRRQPPTDNRQPE